MIIDNPNSHFIFVVHPRILNGGKYTIYQGREMKNNEVMQYWGKWLILGEPEYLKTLAGKFDPLVEIEKIPCIKYDRQPSANLGIKECVMMVYCDRRDRDRIWKILENHGIKLKAWVTEKETMEMWLPGGQLMERWLAATDFDEETKNKNREDAGMRLNYIFEHPDEIFSPWTQ